MVRPVRRRHADPLRVQQLWASVSYIRQQKQIPNLERVSRYMQRTHNLKESEVELQLQYCVQDDLIKEYIAVGCKGVRVGVEQDGYKLPSLDDEWDRGDHDWYCFDCHQPGEVVECSDCWRVVHPTCTEEDWTGEKFTCSVCKTSKLRKPRIKRKELNRLLAYTLARIKANLKTKELHRFGTSQEDQLKVDRLVYRYMDLNLMEDRTNERKYKYLDQFYADCRTILHNVFICFGDVSLMAELAKIMMKDCKYDIEEIRQCKDCYHYSNAKPKDWFCQPCRPAHQLVYAKQKGFSYWPAKVIKVTKEGYDVRFFGGYHQRAYIPESSVKPIETSLKSLNAKRTSGFVKATRELAWHQELLEKAAKNGGDDGAAADGASDAEEEEDHGMESPEIRHKKFRKASHSTSSSSHRRTPLFQEYEFTDVSSSSVQDKSAATPEDANIVTSTGDNFASQRTFSTSDIGVQTSKKLLGKSSPKSTQTDLDSAGPSSSSTKSSCETTSQPGGCKCEAKFNKAFEEYKSRLDEEAKSSKERTAREIQDRLQSEFEEDKQQAVSRAVASVQREVDKARRQADDRAKEQYSEELKKLAIKHKAELSSTKKKQWCYNCEEEAMYHCCWNTSYCSIKCQQEHWHREHKRMCRRKRN